MSERQAMMGHRVELRQKRQRQAVNCEALRDKLRGLLSLVEDVETLDEDAILDTAVVLNTEIAALRLLDRKLGILGRELGE